MNNQELIIEAGKTERHYWKDLWNYRELFYFLAWRDILVRYKQTVIGIIWAVLRPFLTMLVFTIIFGKLAKLPSGGAPYPIMVFAAILPWHLFATSFTGAGNSLISNSNMISKVYFPRLVMPASSVIVSFFDFLISFVILLFLMLWYGFIPDLRIITLPLFVIMAFAASASFLKTKILPMPLTVTKTPSNQEDQFDLNPDSMPACLRMSQMMFAPSSLFGL